MLSFNEACKHLKKVLPRNCVPSYEVDSSKSCNSEELSNKLSAAYDGYVQRHESNSQFKFTPIGCCEIGHFTGNQLFQVFIDICEKEEFNQVGNCIYLNINDKSVGFLVFLKNSLYTKELSPSDDEYKGMFVKLFNDRYVEKHQRDGNQNYNQTEINNFRMKAKGEFPRFLRTKLSDFPFYPYGKCFMGLLAKCSFLMNESNFYRSLSDTKRDFDLIPFPAVIQLAFRTGNTGVIADLLMEYPYRKKPLSDQYFTNIAKQAILTSEELIKAGIPKSPRRHNYFDRTRLKAIKEEIKLMYGVEET